MTAALLLSALLLALAAFSASASQTAPGPVRGMVSVVDYGASYCQPCVLMEPVLKDVARAYRGRAAVVVVDVVRHEDQARRAGVRVIPTQVFFDRSGREVARHVGFLNQKELSARLDELLAR
jgi:thioredoxin 1